MHTIDGNNKGNKAFEVATASDADNLRIRDMSVVFREMRQHRGKMIRSDRAWLQVSRHSGWKTDHFS